MTIYHMGEEVNILGWWVEQRNLVSQYPTGDKTEWEMCLIRGITSGIKYVVPIIGLRATDGLKEIREAMDLADKAREHYTRMTLYHTTLMLVHETVQEVLDTDWGGRTEAFEGIIPVVVEAMKRIDGALNAGKENDSDGSD